MSMQSKTAHRLSRWLLLSVAVLLSATKVAGQDTLLASERTATYLNGRFWEDMNIGEKRAFILGFIEASRTGARDLNLGQNKSEEEYQKAVHTYVGRYYAKEFTYEDHIKELDKLYSDRENLLLSIPLALEYCVLKLGGTRTSAELEQILIGYRKLTSILEELQRKKP
jgi:hypothetical protein